MARSPRSRSTAISDRPARATRRGRAAGRRPPCSITATHLDDIAAGSTTNIHTDFAGGDNSAGTVTATATITYVGTPGSFTQTLGPLSWDSGNEHVHPA